MSNATNHLRALAVLCGILFAALGCSVQSAERPALDGLRRRGTEDRKIVIDAIALDTHKQPLRSLSGDNIRVAVDGRPLAPGSITAHGSQSEPPQIVFVLDVINSTPTDLSRSMEALHTYLHLNGGQLANQTSIFVISETSPQALKSSAPNGNVKTLAKRQLYAYRIPPSLDGLALSRGLEFYEPGLTRFAATQSAVGQSDRVGLSLQALDALANTLQPTPGPKLVIWLSQGWPYLASAREKTSEQMFSAVVYYSDLLRSARMLLFNIDPRGLISQDNSAITEGVMLSTQNARARSGSSATTMAPISDDFYKGFLGPVSNASDADPNDLSLQVLAINSGGSVVQHRNDLTDQVVRCVHFADSLFSFATEIPVVDSGTKFHSISASIRDGNGSIQISPGFYTR